MGVAKPPFFVSHYAAEIATRSPRGRNSLLIAAPPWTKALEAAQHLHHQVNKNNNQEF